jgi:general secretion pathway protein E
MAKLDIAERRVPQDGRIQMSVRGTEIDFRVSTMPSANGETVVLRILDRSAIRLDFERIGLERQTVLAFQEALRSPNGTVLVTGPTGSGKTTTLYAGLAALVDTKRNVISIEDPIEYHLDGVRQIQTQSQIGLTFSEILRSVLRQDPDIIMVGEMRDTETARTALQAALTGHLVLSTLHTNSAAGAITRLRDMGVEPYLIAELLVGVLAQRLVRRLCDHCKREQKVTQQKPADSSLHLLQLGYPNHSLWEAVGCPSCRNTGYRGRLAVGEFLQPSQTVKRLILCNSDERTIREQATEDGMKSMFRSGMDLALNGVTTFDEVVRHLRRDDQC